VRYARTSQSWFETRTEEGRRPAFLVRVPEGVFEAHFHRTRTTTYTVTNQADRRASSTCNRRPSPAGSSTRPARGLSWTSATRGTSAGARTEVEGRAAGDRAAGPQGPHPAREPQRVEPRELEKRGLLDAASRRPERVLALRAASRPSTAARRRERESREIATDQGRPPARTSRPWAPPRCPGLVAAGMARADAQEERLEALRETRRRSRSRAPEPAGPRSTAWSAA